MGCAARRSKAVPLDEQGTCRITLGDGSGEVSDHLWGVEHNLAIGDGDWHHLAISVDRNEGAQVYIDNTEQTFLSLEGMTGSISPAIPFIVGSGDLLASIFAMEFEIDDLALWRRTLTDTQVSEVYRAGLRGENASQAGPEANIQITGDPLPEYQWNTDVSPQSAVRTLTNIGTVPLTLSDFGIVGPHADEYNFLVLSGSSPVYPGETMEFEITWNPNAAELGVREAYLTMSHNYPSHEDPYLYPVGDSRVLERQSLLLLLENFNTLESSLQAAIWEAVPPEVLGWTTTPPEGWVNDTSAMDTGQGVPEWAGWSFTTMEFWNTAGGQDRDEFVLSEGVLAVAESDEYDDDGGAFFDATLISPTVTVPAGQVACVRFHNYYRRVDRSISRFKISVDGGPDQVLKEYQHEDNLNTDEFFAVDPPDHGSDWTLTLKWRHAVGNGWFWAIDNVRVFCSSPDAGKAAADHWMLYD